MVSVLGKRVRGPFYISIHISEVRQYYLATQSASLAVMVRRRLDFHEDVVLGGELHVLGPLGKVSVLERFSACLEES